MVGGVYVQLVNIGRQQKGLYRNEIRAARRADQCRQSLPFRTDGYGEVQVISVTRQRVSCAAWLVPEVEAEFAVRTAAFESAAEVERRV